MEYKLAVGFCDAWLTFLWGQKIIVCCSKIFTWDCRGKDEFLLKVAFFQKMRFIFQISHSLKNIIPNNYPELFTDMGGNFKFQFQDSCWEFFFGEWEIWKTNITFWKKAPFWSSHVLCVKPFFLQILIDFLSMKTI